MAGFVAALFLTENVFLIHAAETNIWTDRQKAVAALERSNQSANDLVKSAQNPQILLASLPHAEPGHVLPYSIKALSDLGISSSFTPGY